jgi:hypothetical protein
METYRIKKYIGSYLAVVGKLDAVVFTAGVGEMSVEARELVLNNLEHIGIILDKGRNNVRTRKQETLITTDDSPVKVFVIPTDEELVITEDTAALLNGTYADHMNFEYSFSKPCFAISCPDTADLHARRRKSRSEASYNVSNKSETKYHLRGVDHDGKYAHPVN